jgi:hypothetical protein
MKRINLTENDILDIVNKVVAEQNTQTTPKELTDEEKIKRFLDGDNTVSPPVPGKRGNTYKFRDKRGLNKDIMQFTIKDVQLIDTQSKAGTTARLIGTISGQKADKTQETVFEFICGSFNDFKLVKYLGSDGTKVEKPKQNKNDKTDDVVLSKPKLPSEVVRFTYVSEPFDDAVDPTDEDLGGLGVFIYEDSQKQLPTNGEINSLDKWLNFYDGENKIKKELDFLGERYSGLRTVFYLFAFNQLIDDNTALNAMFNYINPKITQDFKDYGVKKAPADYMNPKKYKYQIIKTKGRPFQLNAGKGLVPPKPVSADYKVVILQY